MGEKFSKKLVLTRIISAVLTAVFSVSLLTTAVSAYQYPNEYWKYHDPYYAAADKGDDDEVLRLGKIIIGMFKDKMYTDTDLAGNVINKYEAVYKIYQKREDYDNCAVYLKEYIKLAEFLKYDDAAKLAKIRLNHIELNIDVYAETNVLSNVPQFKAKAEPESGSYIGRVLNSSKDANAIAPQDSESILSIYGLFLSESFESFDWFLRQYDNTGKVIHFAWNLKGENSQLKDVLSSSNDSYIINELKYINSFKSPVMIRIFAEMNVWNDLADPETFKQAYIKVAKLARQYAPNAALVFSPNIVSNWNADISDYYPGDEYVDWVGVSLYTNVYNNPYSPAAGQDYSEAYYYNGIYSNPMVQLKDIVQRYGDKKPIIISEGASAYKIKDSDIKLTDSAVKYFKQLYSYMNMVYPQVKAAVYFDASISSSKYEYALNQNEEVRNAFFDTISSVPTLNKSGAKAETAYTKLSEMSGNTLKTLKLSTYAVFPTSHTTSVEYYLDGNLAVTANEYPYTYSCDSSALTEGKHILKAVVINGAYTKTLSYILTKEASGAVSAKSRG